jgi:hypothetical protein
MKQERLFIFYQKVAEPEIDLGIEHTNAIHVRRDFCHLRHAGSRRRYSGGRIIASAAPGIRT